MMHTASWVILSLPFILDPPQRKSISRVLRQIPLPISSCPFISFPALVPHEHRPYFPGDTGHFLPRLQASSLGTEPISK